MIAGSMPLNGTKLHQDVPHILVVDDEVHNRRLLRRILMNDYRITESENARQTLEMLELEAFDLILLDIMMPDMTGLEVLKIIREMANTADLPVILVSALDQNEDMIRGLQLGANDYIAKPFNLDVVRARVNTQLNLKKTMDSYKEAIVELEAAQKMKDHLFRIASHDLKSPLSSVRMAEALLRQFVGREPKAAEVLDMLHRTVRHMNNVIEEFLDMAAYDSSGIDIRLGAVSVEQTVMSVITQYTMTALNKDIMLNVGDLPGFAYADHARLRQILDNLVSNAIKYSPKHTTITLSSEVIGDKICIYVADQGPGIPVNERERLFKEFSKLSTRPTDGESSTGLGLWIVKHMVTLQNGTVGVDCPPDGGSIFWVQLPVSAA